jgi:multisubunit Na+/H+ antiporter MnhG subunit
MRYPLLAFIFVFVIPPFTAHALLTGRATLAAERPTAFIDSAVMSNEGRTTHNWTLPASSGG